MCLKRFRTQRGSFEGIFLTFVSDLQNMAVFFTGSMICTFTGEFLVYRVQQAKINTNHSQAGSLDLSYTKSFDLKSSPMEDSQYSISKSTLLRFYNHT